MLNEQEVLRRAGREVITAFLKSRTCFDLIRPSGKVVVFETRIPIQLAFYALLEHEMMAAPLWDSQRREFAGLMTITDFVDVLRYYHDTHGRSGAAIEVLASRSLAQVLEDAGSGAHFRHATEAREHLSVAAVPQGQQPQSSSPPGGGGGLPAPPPPPQPRDHQLLRSSPGAAPPSWAAGSSETATTTTTSSDGPLAETYGSLVAVDADASLYEACATMRAKRRRFLPVVAPDECGVLGVVTHVDVLRFFVDNFREERRLFDASVRELGIGTFDELAFVTRDTPLRDVLQLLADRDLSAVPVLDGLGRLDAIYNRADITFLAAATDADSVVQNLAAVVGDVLAQRRGPDEPIHTCPVRGSTLQFVFQLFAEVKFRRLFFLDADDKPVGVLSPRDLLAYFL
mmetsp:Transcript_12181/g.49043  ORF Transcript_12181/g.49043 Transcript_12181/m.49043 type:complete len:400 (-) Transcript_12181:351-1550(-)